MTPDPKQIETQLCDFLRSGILAEGVGFDAETPLSEAGVDSFSIVQVLLFIERKFGVIVPESYLTRENLRTVRALSARVGELLSVKKPGASE